MTIVQLFDLAISIVTLIIYIILAIHNKKYFLMLFPVIVLLTHITIYYLCVLFLPDGIVSLHTWSGILRLQSLITWFGYGVFLLKEIRNG